MIVAVGAALFAMGVVFWQRDLFYSLPTPRPAGLVQPPLGQRVALPRELRDVAPAPGRPLLLDFYNADCPCSRFNRDHVRALLDRFARDVTFVAVVETAGASEDGPVDSGIAMPHVVDRGAAIAKSLGVYSTPQAVLLEGDGRLVYRGNYNTSRYCTEPRTQFVRIALENVLQRRVAAAEPEAGVAYGCALPGQECRDDR